MASRTESWPELPYEAWKDTYATLHMWTQIAGKIRLVQTPWLNHSWHVVLYLSPRGLTHVAHPLWRAQLRARASILSTMCWWYRPATARSSASASIRAPSPISMPSSCGPLAELGIEIRINDLPNELPDPIRFSQDRTHASYDPEFAARHWRLLARIEPVLFEFRTAFIGKSSPVHFFWGSFDLAVTRFSGRRAPLHPGGVPHLPDAVAQEAYSHEVSSAGFWPGNEVIPYPAFYAYAYPEPPGFAQAAIGPADSFYSGDLHEYILPYDTVRNAENPERALMDFLMSTYDAAASLGKWDRAALDCAIGVPGEPRAIGA